MQKSMFIISSVFVMLTAQVKSQDLVESQIPSGALNSFKNEFPKAKGIEWEQEGNLYKVDFEIKRQRDIEIWYHADGTASRKEEEIGKSSLPKAVEKTLASEFSEYKIKDITMVTEGETHQYKMDLESRTQGELDIKMDGNGKILHTRVDSF